MWIRWEDRSCGGERVTSTDFTDSVTVAGKFAQRGPQSVRQRQPEASADDDPVCPPATQNDRACFHAEGLDREPA